MTALDELMTRPQYSIAQDEKERLLLAELRRLTAHHRASCPEYARVLDALPAREYASVADIPYLPVSVFKTHLLSSVPDPEVFKTMTSSGTTGQQVSRIVLDRATAELQTRALSAIMTTLLGPRRMPMIIVDTPNVVRDRKSFSARGAGVLGMLNFGRKHFYALDDDMDLDFDGLRRFCDDFGDGPVLIFGFTFMVWKYLHQQLEDAGVDLLLPNATLVHSGGWKKLQEQAVGNAEFKEGLRRSAGVARVHNFYGMVEQVGGVFLESEDGYLHPPNFSDVIVRDPVTWHEAPNGATGVIEVLSALPWSYPGSALLTEDLGIVHGVGAPERGWAGKQLEIVGRAPKSELRGCSDVHAYDLGLQ